MTDNTNKTKKKKKGMLIITLQRMVKNPGARAGTILLALIILACIFAPLIAPYDPTYIDYENIKATPSLSHICGTDVLGRDIFSRLLYGGRYSLAIGICASLFGNGIGVILGSIAGYFGGIVETAIMRIMDIWSSVPGILLSILVSAALGSGFFNTMLALSIGGVPHGVRMTRGQILGERGKEYLEAAESINCSKISIMFRHLLPNVISPTIVSITMGIGGTITSAASLSYIGLGVQPPTAEWGAMLSMGKDYIRTYPHMIMFPGIAIALTVLAINLMGDGLRDALDPKLRS